MPFRRSRRTRSALVQAWLPGEEGGNGIVDVLTGRVDPSGRLPVSMPRTVGQVPVYASPRAGGGRSMFYDDYTDCSPTPLFPFGHGLSYATFEHGDLTVEAAGSTAEPVVLSIETCNTSDRAGTDVVQLVVTDEVASVARHRSLLCGFAKVPLEPGETADRAVHRPPEPARLLRPDRCASWSSPATSRFASGTRLPRPCVGGRRVRVPAAGGGGDNRRGRLSGTVRSRIRRVLRRGGGAPVVLPDLRRGVRDRGDRRRRAGGAGARRRRPPRVPWVHVLEGARPGRVAPSAGSPRPAAAAGVEVGWDEVLDDLAGVLGSTIIGAAGPTRSRSTSPPAWPTTRPGRWRSATWLGSIGSRSFYTAATVDNAPGARRRRARGRQRDAQPGVGAGRATGCCCWSARTRSCRTATARPCPTRSATSAPSAAAAGASGCSTRGAPRRQRSPTSTWPSGPGPTSAVLAALAAALLADGADADELSDVLHRRGCRRAAHGARAVHDRRERPRPRASSAARSSASSPTCGRTAAGSRSSAAPARRWPPTASSPSGCGGCC